MALHLFCTMSVKPSSPPFQLPVHNLVIGRVSICCRQTLDAFVTNDIVAQNGNSPSPPPPVLWSVNSDNKARLEHLRIDRRPSKHPIDFSFTNFSSPTEGLLRLYRSFLRSIIPIRALEYPWRLLVSCHHFRHRAATRNLHSTHLHPQSYRFG